MDHMSSSLSLSSEQGSPGIDYHLPNIKELHFFNNLDKAVLLKEIEMCENAEELRSLLEIEEKSLIIVGIDEYQSLYRKTFDKALMMGQIILELLRQKETSSFPSFKDQRDYSVPEKENKVIASQKETIAIYQRELAMLHEEIRRLKLENSDLSESFDKNLAELKKYQGDPEALRLMNMNAIEDLEEKFLNSLKKMSKYKTKIIFDYYDDIQTKNQKIKEASMKLCLICLENPISVLLKPCNHASICENCAKKLSECPFDRRQVLSYEKIFL